MSLPVFSRFGTRLRDDFAEIGRSPQLVPFGNDVFSVRNVEGKELRRYAPVVSIRDGDLLRAVNNFTEFQRAENAVSILMDPQGRMGLVEQYRPVLMPKWVGQYVAWWDNTQTDPIAFVDQVANWLGRMSLECPQGYSEMFEKAINAAKREGGEEGRHRVLGALYYGNLATDPATRVDLVKVFLVKVDPSQPASEQPDPLEVLSGKPTQWVTEHEFLTYLASGHVFNALTVGAYGLLRAHGIWS